MKLKNFNTYYNKILDYCKIMEIDVYDFPKLDNAMYLSKVKRIYIDPKFKGSDMIAILLHEIGHYEDDTITDSKAIDKLYERAAKKIDKEKSLNQKEFDCIMRCETNAWLHGRIIAKKLKIPLGKWYKKQMTQALHGYWDVKVHVNVQK